MVIWYQVKEDRDDIQMGAVSFLHREQKEWQQEICAGAMMTGEEIEYVKKCIEKDIHNFYIWGKWKRTRKIVLQMDHGECQRCKEKKRYAKATTVHHVNYVKRHPELALEIWYEWHGAKKRNLISLCHDCHEEVHGYRKPEEKKPLTEERWD